MRIRVKYVQTIKKRGGRKGDRTLHYYRHAGAPDNGVRLPDNPTSPAFHDALVEYNARTAEALSPAPDHPELGSFVHLVKAYLKSPEYSELKPKTQGDYRQRLDKMNARFGKLAVRGITRDFVLRYRDRMAAHPHDANANLRVLRLLLNFAGERRSTYALPAGWTNPALRFRGYRVQPRDQIWSAATESKFLEAAGKAGDAEVALGFMLLAFLAQRLGDVLKLTWHDYDGRKIACRQEKSGALVWVPVHRELRAALGSVKRRGVCILCRKDGQPFKARHFAARWDAIAAAADVDGLQRRDLRRTAMVRMAEAGATPTQVAAVSGHTIDSTARILETYVPRTAAMAEAAIAALERSQGTKGTQNCKRSTASGVNG